MKKVILFICKGNIFRSPVAEHLLRRILEERGLSRSISVISRGLQGAFGMAPTSHANITGYEKEWRAARPTLERFGIDLSLQASMPVDEATILSVRIIIVMDNDVLSVLKNNYPECVDRMRLFNHLEDSSNDGDVRDPATSSDPDEYQALVEYLDKTLRNRFHVLRRWID